MIKACTQWRINCADRFIFRCKYQLFINLILLTWTLTSVYNALHVLAVPVMPFSSLLFLSIAILFFTRNAMLKINSLYLWFITVQSWKAFHITMTGYYKNRSMNWKFGGLSPTFLNKISLLLQIENWSFSINMNCSKSGVTLLELQFDFIVHGLLLTISWIRTL